MKNTRECILFENNLLIDKLPDGQLEIRKTIIDEEGDTVYHRYVIHPGQDVSQEDARIKQVATTYHTPAVVETWWKNERRRQNDVV